MYEDACEMHLYFVSERDKLCKDGLRMTSRALNSILKSLQNEIEAERKAKLQMEHEEEDEDDPKRNKFRLEETTSNFEVVSDTCLFLDQSIHEILSRSRLRSTMSVLLY